MNESRASRMDFRIPASFVSTWNVILSEERRRIFAQDDSANVV